MRWWKVLLAVVVMISAASCGSQRPEGDRIETGAAEDTLEPPSGVLGERIVAEGEIRRAEDFVPFGKGLAGTVAFGDGSLWLTERISWKSGACDDTGGGMAASCPGYESAILKRLDPETRRPTATWRLRNAANASVTFGADAVWVSKADSVLRLAPETNGIEDTIPIGAALGGIAFGADALWATGIEEGILFRVNPETGDVEQEIKVGGEGTDEVAVGEGAVWVANERELVRVDAETNEVVAEIPTEGGAFRVAVGDGAVWVTGGGGKLFRVDPKTNEVVARIDVGDQCWDVEASAGGVWAVGESTGRRVSRSYQEPETTRLARVDPETNRVVGSVRLEGTNGDAAIGGDTVWLVTSGVAWAGDRLTRITP